MIVSFSVSNFRSFSSEVTFSLVASNRLTASHEGHAVPIPDSDQKVLRVAVLYGANGAGKSNLFKALRFLKSIALGTRQKDSGTGRTPFRFGDWPKKPSEFDLQFIGDGKLYRFGFKLDDDRILEEWLVQVIGGREKALYERTTDARGEVSIEIGEGLRESDERLRALAKVGGPPNQSFLATAQATLAAPHIGAQIGGILEWFKTGLNLVTPDQPFGGLGQALASEPELTEFAGAYLKSSATGVDHLDIRKIEMHEDEVRRLLPEGLVSRLREDAKQHKTALLRMPDGTELLVDGPHGARFNHIEIRAAHKDSDQSTLLFNLAEESDGTIRLLQLVPALHNLRRVGGAYFIDEIDRSLHPLLVWKFLEFFLHSCASKLGQVIVTSHESNLLDLDLLRRDEIWFAEKDADSSTHLYSLLDFKVRNDLEIRKHYLQGRFGAIPFLGNLDRLRESQQHP